MLIYITDIETGGYVSGVGEWREGGGVGGVDD